MSENEIKPVAWRYIGLDEDAGFTDDPKWAEAYPYSHAPLYDQSAIDALTKQMSELKTMLSIAEFQRKEMQAERDTAVVDAERYRWVRLRIGGREAVEDDFKWEYESGECLAQEVDAAIDAARSEGG